MSGVQRIKPLIHTATHVDENGKPSKDFFNWLTKISASMVTPDSTDTLTNKTLAASSDVLGGVTVDVGSDATGDIWYRNSGGLFTRLPIGSSGNVLTVSGGLPSWATPGSGLTYLATIATVSSAIVDSPSGTNILGANNSKYRTFKFIARNIVPSTGALLQIQVHASGSFQSSTYLGVAHTSAIGSSTQNGSGAGINLTANNNTDAGLSGEWLASDLSNTGIKKFFYGTTASIVSGVGESHRFGGVWNGGNNAIDGFQIVSNTGTISSGNVDIYGIQ